MASTVNNLILDRYQPLRQAGQGGFASVVVAFDTRIQRTVALKIIKLSASEEARAALPGANAVALDPDGALLAHGAHMKQDAAPAHGQGGSYRSPHRRPVSADKLPLTPDTMAWDTADTVALEDIPPWEDTPQREQKPGADTSYDAIPTTALSRRLEPNSPILAHGIEATMAASSSDIESRPPLMTHLPGLDEARTAAMLNDPSIVTVYDFEVRDGYAYLIMEYIEGLTLAELLYSYHDEITLDMITAVFSGVARALQVAHERNVLHLDVKPDNVLITKKGQVKVTDFGLATLADASGAANPGGGTIAYMPLEQLMREPVDARSDEWALASLTYEMFSGEQPFDAETFDEAKEKIQDAELLLPSLCWEDLPEEADDVMFRALAIKRENRFESVQKFSDELMPYLGNAKTGVKELKGIVSSNDPGIPLEEAISRQREPLPPLRDRITLRHRRVGARVVSSLGAALLCLLAATTFSNTAGWGFSGVAVQVIAALGGAAFGALLPRFAPLLAYGLMGLSFLLNNSPATGAVLLVSTALWWYYIGREDATSANGGFAFPLVGACWLGPLTPLVIGMIERPMHAMGTTAFSLVVALSLVGSWTSGILADILTNLVAWPVGHSLIYGIPAVSQPTILALLLQPSFWVTCGAWMVAAFVFAVFRNWYGRGYAYIGALFATAVLIAGVVVGALVAQTSVTAPPVVSACIAGAIMLFVSSLIPDEEVVEDADAEE